MTSMQYPAQTGLYKIVVKSEQSPDKLYDYKDVRLQISVGQKYHEGEKFEATIEWCRHRFGHVQICVNDTLQKYNHMFDYGLSNNAAEHKSMLQGLSWVQRNRDVIKRLPSFELVHWSSWLEHPDYTPIKQKIDELYNFNSRFHLAINTNIDLVWQRKVKKFPDLYTEDKFPLFHRLSKDFLLEEAAAFSIMFDQMEAIDIYPGTIHLGAMAFQGCDGTSVPSGLTKGHFCRIDFARNKNVVRDHIEERKSA